MAGRWLPEQKQRRGVASAWVSRSRVVLVAEDEILIRSTAADYLRNRGYAVIEAASGEEAIAVLTTGEPVDAIFTDVEMCGSLDGLTLANWVGQHRPEIPVMLTSGRRDPVFGEKLFVAKPYRLAEVTSQIHHMLEERENAAARKRCR
jgi:CheY-like chemotaxis protein